MNEDLELLADRLEREFSADTPGLLRLIDRHEARQRRRRVVAVAASVAFVAAIGGLAVSVGGGDGLGASQIKFLGETTPTTDAPTVVADEPSAAPAVDPATIEELLPNGEVNPRNTLFPTVESRRDPIADQNGELVGWLDLRYTLTNPETGYFFYHPFNVYAYDTYEVVGVYFNHYGFVPLDVYEEPGFDIDALVAAELGEEYVDDLDERAAHYLEEWERNRRINEERESDG